MFSRVHIFFHVVFGWGMVDLGLFYPLDLGLFLHWTGSVPRDWTGLVPRDLTGLVTRDWTGFSPVGRDSTAVTRDRVTSDEGHPAPSGWIQYGVADGQFYMFYRH